MISRIHKSHNISLDEVVRADEVVTCIRYHQPYLPALYHTYTLGNGGGMVHAVRV